MKINSKPRKIRIIMKPSNASPSYGVVLPPYFHTWLGIHVTVRESGTQIILESGALPTALSKSALRSTSKKIGEVYV